VSLDAFPYQNLTPKTYIAVQEDRCQICFRMNFLWRTTQTIFFPGQVHQHPSCSNPFPAGGLVSQSERYLPPLEHNIGRRLEQSPIRATSVHLLENRRSRMSPMPTFSVSALPNQATLEYYPSPLLFRVCEGIRTLNQHASMWFLLVVLWPLESLLRWRCLLESSQHPHFSRVRHHFTSTFDIVFSRKLLFWWDFLLPFKEFPHRKARVGHHGYDCVASACVAIVQCGRGSRLSPSEENPSVKAATVPWLSNKVLVHICRVWVLQTTVRFSHCIGDPLLCHGRHHPLRCHPASSERWQFVQTWQCP